MAAGATVAANMDFDVWACEQVRRLRGCAVEGIDTAGISQTLQDLVESRKASARGAARRIIVALLLSDSCKPGYRPTCISEMVQAAHELSGFASPSVADMLDHEFPRLYRSALEIASERLRDMGGNPASLPRMPPWTWRQIFGAAGFMPI